MLFNGRCHDTPCPKTCPDRTGTCHTYCINYIPWRAQKTAESAARRAKIHGDVELSAMHRAGMTRADPKYKHAPNF